jgi:diaminopimelate decarboxylase
LHERPTAIDPYLQRAAELFGTPSYVYCTSPIEDRIARLHEAFGGRFSLSFAAKCNPNPVLLGWLKDRVAFLDVSSIGEFRLALNAGWDGARVSFTGPGKRHFEISEAIEGGIGELILESVREAELADQMARSMGRVQDVMIRIAPTSVPKGFGDQMAGRPSAFGIDLECLPVALPRILAMPNLRLTGLHIFSGTQCLRPEAVLENYRGFIEIYRDICGHYGLRPEKLVFGSGLGIPYHDGDTALDLDAVGRAIAGDLDLLMRIPSFANSRLVLELGRYLVGEAGYFLTRVISIKDSRGARIAICDGGMNNHLPASGHFGMVMQRNYSMHKVGGGEATGKFDLVGPLCTSIDRLARGVMLPPLAEGDLIAVHNSGAYGLTASPVHFISHAPPREILVDGNDMRDVTRNLGNNPSASGGHFYARMAPEFTAAEGSAVPDNDRPIAAS